jgi:hypothetical protein
MNALPNQHTELLIRPIQYRDLDVLEQFLARVSERKSSEPHQLAWLNRWYWPLKLLSLFPNPWRQLACIFAAEAKQQVVGFIHV